MSVRQLLRPAAPLITWIIRIKIYPQGFYYQADGSGSGGDIRGSPGKKRSSITAIKWKEDREREQRRVEFYPPAAASGPSLTACFSSRPQCHSDSTLAPGSCQTLYSLGPVKGSTEGSPPFVGQNMMVESAGTHLRNVLNHLLLDSLDVVMIYRTQISHCPPSQVRYENDL